MSDAFATDARHRQSQSLSLWMPRLASAESQNAPNRDLATARSRDLMTSSAYMANAIRIHRDNVIGPRFTLALRPLYQLLGISMEASSEWSILVEREWEAYANSPTFDVDAARKLTFPWMLHMAYQSFLTAGESLAVVKWKESFGGYSTCLQMIEPERLSNPPDRMPSEYNIRNGVEFDRDGAPTWYYIKAVHPSDVMLPYNSPNAYKWLRIKRRTPWGRPIVLHMLDHTRAEMRRGISQLASVLKHMKLLDEYEGAEVESAIMRTMVAAVIKTELPESQVHQVMGARPTAAIAKDAGVVNARALEAQQYMQGIYDFRKEQALTMNGARIAQLLPGETLELLQAKIDGAAYADFQTAVVRKLAAGAGTTAESLSRDFGQMSYASAMVSLGDIWRSFLVKREMVIRQKAMPFVMAWLEEAIDEKRLPLPSGKFGTFEDLVPLRNAIFARSTFMSWGMPSPDPVKQREAQRQGIMSGLSTHQEEAYSEGLDWRELLDQQAAERAYKEKLEIPQLENLPPGQPQELIDAAAEPNPAPASPAKKKSSSG